MAMPIFGSDTPTYVKDSKHREALEEIKRIVLGERRNCQRQEKSREERPGKHDSDLRYRP